MKIWWSSLSLGTRLNVLIQAVLIIILSVAHFWTMRHISDGILNAAERRASVSADGVINGMNMLMLTGMISYPENRRLFIKKMSASEDVKELRIIRAKQVQDQFGPGLPEEQIQDDMDRRAIETKRPQFKLIADPKAPALRTVVPFIVSTNFRGTNCLMCHHVEVGSVNGAASITLDMTEDFEAIKYTRTMLWLGQIGLQILLFFATRWLITRATRPLINLQTTMEAMQRSRSMEDFTPTESSHADEVGKLTAAFNKMSEALRDSERSMKLAASIYRSNAEAIMVTDENNLIVDVNPAFTEITGYTRAEVVGKNPRILKSGRHDNAFYQQMWQMILRDDHWHGEIWDKRKDGEIYAKLANISVLRHSDGSIYRYVAQFSDITEKKQKDELVQWQANYDPLTNLPNRRLFQDRLEQEIKKAHRTGLPLALMFIDLDYFKKINDSLGHTKGDILLMEAARRISSCVRETDTVARLGGDEFTVIMAEFSDIAQTTRVAKTIIHELSQPFFFMDDEKSYYISASIGITIYPDDATDIKHLLNHADQAMYAAKGEGRGCFKYFSESAQ
ncbi:MAG: diguanylate cyclase [Sideroxydans sp.]|nr:diguanylate cyclase [Sideroxydans sp.]